MKLTTSSIKNTLTIAGLTVLLAASVSAQTKLSLSKTSANTISVNLENGMPVAGLQFTITSTSNLKLGKVMNSGRTEDSNWQIHQNQINDSTIKVVVINSSITDIPAGEGAIAVFSFSDNGSVEVSRVALECVVIADQFARKVTVEIANAEWSSSIAQEKEFTLEQNYPNPFNPSTTIRYTLEQPGQVRLTIYDITGRQVMQVLDQYQIGGTYGVTWNGRDDAGRQVASGVYFAQLNMNGKFATLKMNLLK